MVPKICLTHLSAFKRSLILIQLIKTSFRTYDLYALFHQPSHTRTLLSISESIKQMMSQLDYEMVHFTADINAEIASGAVSEEHRGQYEELQSLVVCLMKEACQHKSTALHE